MELGEKLRQARQEAGLSQRQLCEGIITRNMLSQIEHGTARPSMDTLCRLSARLEKPVGYFLEEDAAMSPNQKLIETVRKAAPAEGWQLLKDFRTPDPVLEWEWSCRSMLAGLAAARQALESGRPGYARQILEEMTAFAHGIPELEHQRLLLLGAVPGISPAETVRQLPSLDRELLLRAEAALEEKQPERALQLLAAAENREHPRWALLQGQAQLLSKAYAPAAESLQKAETAYPQICRPLLEVCFRELGDFKNAYLYACRQR